MMSLLDLELEQLDVHTTFLYGDLGEMIYIQQPEGLLYPDKKTMCVY